MSDNRSEILEKVDKALDDVRPHLETDGGNVEVVEITEDFVVKIKWLGACESCSMSTMTMRAGIEQTLKAKVPEITGVEAVNGVNA